MFGLSKKENRESVESENVALTPHNLMQSFMINYASANGVTVTLDDALEIPAVWAAVNFLSGTIAGLPLNVYQRKKDGREKVKGNIQNILHDAVNDEMSSFAWRKYSFDRVFTGGRSLTLIDRDARGNITDLWPLNPEYVTVKSTGASKKYTYKLPNTDGKTYEANEIIDIPFMLAADGITAKSPLLTNKNAIGLAIASTEYASKFFANGGVPPFVMTGPISTGKGLQRASDDLASAIKKIAKQMRQVLTLPSGHEIKPIGVDPEKTQMIEIRKFCNEEIARIYSLPVIFIQDLSKGTFSNTEQQDLHLVKHTIKRWIEQTEQELNIKLFGRRNKKYFVEFNLDGLLRGDFKTRMEGYAKAIQNAIATPNEVRRKENMKDDDAGDSLMIQGATVPVKNQLNLTPEEKPEI